MPGTSIEVIEPARPEAAACTSSSDYGRRSERGPIDLGSAMTTFTSGSRGRLLPSRRRPEALEPLPNNEGMPAAPNTGEIVAVGADGTFTTVVSGLNQPTSLELVGHVGFVVTLTGTILRIDRI